MVPRTIAFSRGACASMRRVRPSMPRTPRISSWRAVPHGRVAENRHRRRHVIAILERRGIIERIAKPGIVAGLGAQGQGEKERKEQVLATW